MKFPFLNIRFTIFSALMSMMCLLVGCSDANDSLSAGPTGYTTLILQVKLDDSASEIDADQKMTRGSFDNFDNELDKWGIDGENMESLRVIIIAGNGEVEHNNYYTTDNANDAGEYEYTVTSPDTKKVFLIANEERVSMDVPGMEYMGASSSLSAYLKSIRPGNTVNFQALQDITLSLDRNSSSQGCLNTPLPISAVYTQEVPEIDGAIEQTYYLHRAAVKYSFRIVNESTSSHTFNAVSIDRVSSREYLFPNCVWTQNSLGHTVVDSYTTPSSATEKQFSYVRSTPLLLPAKMDEAVEALPQPLYFYEGLVSNDAQRISISLDGQPLDVWRELKWRKPGQPESAARPMTDLPRNTHVVVNITIKDNEIKVIADIQPYALVQLKPNFGLDRDPDGNIIVERHPDGTYDVIINGETVTRDINGDYIIKRFTDGTLLCLEEIYKDYIHDTSEQDYYKYYLEKDGPNGNMIIIRQITNGDMSHGVNDADIANHNHGINDRPLFVLTSDVKYYRVLYDSKGNPSLTDRDIHNDSIVQANGFQFRNDNAYSAFPGTYIVQLTDGSLDLRDAHTGKSLNWPSVTVAALRSRLFHKGRH